MIPARAAPARQHRALIRREITKAIASDPAIKKTLARLAIEAVRDAQQKKQLRGRDG